MSFLSNSEKEELSNVMDELHDTYARDFFYYRTAHETIIQTEVSHNFLFGGSPTNTETTTVQQSGTIRGRIQWGSKQDISSMFPTQVILEDGQCRIKVDPSGKAILDSAERVVIDGIPCVKNSSSRPHGLFNVKHFTYIYQRST